MDMNHQSSISICTLPRESPCSESRPSSSQGRYTEEARRCSNVGFVAQRKAFFEDYFSKRRTISELKIIAQKQRKAMNPGVILNEKEEEEDGDLSEETEIQLQSCSNEVYPSFDIDHNMIPYDKQVMWTTSTSTSEIEEIDIEIKASVPSSKQKRKDYRFPNWPSNLKFMMNETTAGKNKEQKKNKARKAFSRFFKV